MRFTVSASSGRARLGHLALSGGPDHPVAMATPGYLIYNRCGSDPHLPQSPAGILLTPLNHWLDKLALLRQAGNLRQLCRLRPDRQLLLSLTDHLDYYPTPGVTAQHVGLPTRSGKAPLTVELQAELTLLTSPELVQPLADCEIRDGDGRKRARKSVDRSLAFYDRFVTALEQQGGLGGGGPALMASWVGGYSAEERLRCLRELESRGADGLVVEGFRYYNQPVEDFRLAQCESVLTEALQQQQRSQPPRPLYFPGLVHPADIIRAAELGFDLFDGSLPALLTRRGLAWLTSVTGGSWWLHVGDVELLTATDRPLDPGCCCRCCRQFSLSYLAHLSLSNEILASILLMEHNSARLAAFFNELRSAIGSAESLGGLATKYAAAVVPPTAAVAPLANEQARLKDDEA
ncbi:hypothetical protein BOX15_Mlig015555g1 [Macrostomum lignano]|uniref:tRNA-guanine(15) transglycosylase-like domain-containing protein n=1 Tax=Macrostomum lignano TaxID=282301 RepID=A0A267H868_9PLAT|nr:hypothetical protein BOX15_Mlig015555g1 [Macrostomum lignano]